MRYIYGEIKEGGNIELKTDGQQTAVPTVRQIEPNEIAYNILTDRQSRLALLGEKTIRPVSIVYSI